MNLRADTQEARAIWAAVDKAAKRCPEWAKPMVEETAAEWAKRILAREAQEELRTCR